MSSSRQRPPIKLNPWSLVAIVFPLGLAPKAPGTFGSLAGIPVGLLFYAAGAAAHGTFGIPAWITVTTLLVLFTAFTWVAIDRTERSWKTHDDGRIVIDEVLGQAIPLGFIAGDWKIVLASFILFRFFDIVKPGPIGWADRSLPGAWGTLLDDVIAGIFAWLLLAAAMPFF